MFKKPSRYINREISWLAFNRRVLQEAENPSVPLIERMRFLGIFSNNLDEFFRVRVATLRRLMEYEKKAKEFYGDNPKVILSRIKRLVTDYQKRFDSVFLEIKKELEKEHVFLLSETQLLPEHIDFINDFFESNLTHSLSPIMLDQVNTFPELNDMTIYLAVKMTSKKKMAKEYSIIEIPTNNYSRFIVLPSNNENSYIILLEDVIRFCLHKVFSTFSYDHFEAYTIKITRDAELDVDNDISESFLERLAKGVKNRKKGDPVRFVYDSKISGDLLSYLVQKMDLDQFDTVIPGGRYHNFRDFIKFPSLGKNHLVNPPLPPITIPILEKNRSMLHVIKGQDIIFHYPYHSFSYYIRLLKEAAVDPDVKSIKISLYRVATDSKVVRALINAAQNGKEVTAMVELKARFDERSNIKWAERMEEAGVNVIFGVAALKVHSKMTLITRQEGPKLIRYATVSTGNFHEGNASIYTDITLLTSDGRITSEIERVFNFLEHPYKIYPYRHTLVSPNHMRKRLYTLIDKEIENAKDGKEAYLLAKINNLVDFDVIEKLYEANKAGVTIKIIIRGICSLIPGIPGLSEKIEVVSIIDRFLEHSRIFIFANGGNEICYISSADWMTRNLDRRVEVAAPIFDPKIKEDLKNVILYGLKDNQKSRIIEENLNNTYKTAKDKKPFRSQLELYKYYKAQSED
jgi:polyphosphate kinase